jgi:aryl-alcohol dehydrogenase-like predicted oxidoreductase
VERRPIGGLSVWPIGLGCYPLTGGYGPVEPAEAIRTIHAALDSGVELLDTSDAYAGGANEALVGRALAGRRYQAVLATKFGWVVDAQGLPVGLDSSPARVRAACEASLRRLRIDTIDVYFQHRVDPSTPIEDTVDELGRLVSEGKVREFGLSEAAETTLRRARRAGPLAALQTEYSLWFRDPETSLLPVCEELGVTFVAYSPLGRGLLAGSVTDRADLDPADDRRNHPRFEPAHLERNLELVSGLTSIAQGLGLTAAQLALAWVLVRPGAVALVGTRRAHHLAEDLRSLERPLGAQTLAQLDERFRPGSGSGARHPASHLPTIDRG